MPTTAARLALALALLTLVAPPLAAQPTDAQPTDAAEVPSDFVDMDTLRALLPQEVGRFALTRSSAGPFIDADGWENEHGRTLLGRYAAERDTFIVALSHFERDRHRADALPMPWKATETSVAGHAAFAEEDPARVVAFVGETFAAVAEATAGDVTPAQLVAALEAVDLAELEALDQAYTGALEAAMGPDVAPTDAIADVEGQVDCAAFNAEVKASAQEMMGASAFAPWVRFLAEEEAATAEREDGESVVMLSTAAVLTFPKEGNAWLRCVRENDVLWAPLGPTSFLVRVKELWELEDRAAFRVEPAGFGDVMQRGRVEVEAGG